MSEAWSSKKTTAVKCQRCGGTFNYASEHPTHYCLACGSDAIISQCPRCELPFSWGLFCPNCGMPQTLDALLAEAGIPK